MIVSLGRTGMMLVMEVESRGVMETMLNRIPWRSFGVKTRNCVRGAG
jgi:hypothetical protein